MSWLTRVRNSIPFLPKRETAENLWHKCPECDAMVFLKEMLREGWVEAKADYARFKNQLARVPADQLPQDRRFNPLAIGESRQSSVDRIVFVEPLGMAFNVIVDDEVVYVTAVWLVE